MIDVEANFDNILDMSEQVQTTAKFQPKKQPTKLRKASLSSRSAAPNPTVQTGDRKIGALNQVNSSKEVASQERASLTGSGSEKVDNLTNSQSIPEIPSEDAVTLPGASASDSISQDDDRHNVDSSNLATSQEDLAASDIHVSPASACGRTIDDIVEFGETFDAQTKEKRVAKFQPKAQAKPLKAATKSQKTNKKVEASTVDVVSYNGSDNNMQTTLHDDQAEDPRTHESVQTSDSEGLFATDMHISEVDNLANIDGILEEETIANFRPKLRPRPAKASSKVAGTNGNVAAATPIVGTCADDNDMCTVPKYQETITCPAPQHYITEEQYSNDQADNDCGYHEEEPLDNAVEKQPKSNVGEIGPSMELWSRKGLHKTLTHAGDDYFGEECVEPSLAAEDNDGGDDYTAGTKRKVRKKSRDVVEESQQHKFQKDKSQVSSWGCKRTLKDKLAEKPEKKNKLTHRIRRTKEVKTLLETPREEIDPMKLSAAHLRLLQEARERVSPKQIPSEPSSNTSFQLEDIDDFDYRDDEARNLDNDRTENHVQNATKLNCHSYMNKPSRGKWSKSDTDLFYQGLRQFGSDFAMIQQLFHEKTRHQITSILKR